MFIVWGKKIVYRKLGHVADFCPLCRTPKAMSVRRIGLAGHVYYITAGEGELVGHDRTCSDCKTAFEANPANYASLSKKPLPLAELKTMTFPDMDEALRERLALEEKLRKTPAFLSSEERYALVRSPFLLLSPKVEERFAGTKFDREVGFAMAGALLLILAMPALGALVLPEQPELLILGAIAAGAVLVVWQIAVSGRRFMRREIIPRLDRALKPLRPTRAEVEQVLGEMKQYQHKMAGKLRLDDLFSHMEGQVGAG
jgi:hypothetical protein